jgi:MFS family permease
VRDTSSIPNLIAPDWLRGRDQFAPLWVSSGLSNLADGLMLVALPVLATSLTRWPPAVGLVSALGGLPWLTSPLIGALVDRSDRRRAIVVGNLVRTMALGIVAVLTFSSLLKLPMLYALSIFLGFGEVTVDSAGGALVASVCPHIHLESANSRLKVTATVNNYFVGPPIAGVLEGANPGLGVGFAACLMGLAAISCVMITGSHRSKADRSSSSGIFHDAAEGIRWVVRRQVTRRLAVMLAAIVTGISMTQGILVLYAIRPGPVGLTVTQYGLVLWAGAVGSVLGAAVLARLRRAVPMEILLSACVVGGVFMLVLPAAVAHWVPLVLALLIGSMSEMVWSVLTQSYVQRHTPEQYLGRVGSAFTMLTWGSIPLGSALGGIVAGALGTRAAFLLATALVVVVGGFTMPGLITCLREESTMGATGVG